MYLCGDGHEKMHFYLIVSIIYVEYAPQSSPRCPRRIASYHLPRNRAAKNI
jgi:hypothetical protein